MKKIIALLILILALPTVTALAASVTSKSFVVRNWMATPLDPSPTPDPTPVTTPASTTPAPTDDVETMETEEVGQGDEPEEQGEEPLADDEPLTADEEQAIPPVDENEDGQGEADEFDADEAPSTDPTTDEVEQSEETAAVGTPADDGEEEITINTEEETVEPEEAGEEPPTVIDIVEAGSEEEPEPEEAGEARVDIGGAEGDGGFVNERSE